MNIDAHGPSRPPAGEPAIVVLVVEDEGAVRRIVERILSRHRYRVVPASSAEDALAILRESGDLIDLVLTDIVMPKMSGIELLNEMKRLGLPHPLILMSGYTDQGVRDPASIERATAFLAKPFNEKTLLRAIASATSSVAASG